MSLVYKQNVIQTPSIFLSGSPFSLSGENLYSVSGDIIIFGVQFPFDVITYYSYSSNITKNTMGTYNYVNPIEVNEDKEIYILGERVQDGSQTTFGPYNIVFS